MAINIGRLLGVQAGAFILLLAGVPSASAGWQLTFKDEFNGNKLDKQKWKLSDFWGNQTLPGNGEKQCYVSDGVKQSDGLLLLIATRSQTSPSACKGASSVMQYTSGMVTTAGCNQYEAFSFCQDLKPFTQTYGYFEIRAKLPKGKGLWPAFWLLPIDGSTSEIDVMESLGQDPTVLYQTFHYRDSGGEPQKASNIYRGQDFSSTFSVFGIDWRPGLLVWYVDEREVFRFASPAVTSRPAYALLNLAVGGYWPGDPEPATVFPSVMSVDYIRIYKRVEDGLPDDVPPKS